MLNQMHKFHKTKLGLLVFGVVELAIAYGFISLSIDRGNLWWYLLTLVFLVASLQNLTRFIGSFFNAKKHR